MAPSNRRVFALIAIAGAAVLGVITRNRTPADIRRFEYQPTLLEEAYAIGTDPLQLGMLAGAVAGAIGIALLRAGDQAAQLPRPNNGLRLTVTDPSILTRANKAAELAIEQTLNSLKN